MALVEFESVYIKNFSSITEATVPLSKVGLCLIAGMIDGNPDSSNGSGKTSLGEALYFGITGDFFEPSTKNIDVINRFQKDAMEIIISGNKSDIPFVITRVLKKSGKSVIHNLEFHINNELQSSSGIPETQEQINTFLGTTPLLLLNSRMFGQGEISSFTRVDDRHKKIIIDNIVGVGKLEKVYKRCKDIVSSMSTKLTLLKMEHESNKTNLSQTQERLRLLRSNHVGWEENQQTQLRAQEVKLNQIGNEIGKLEKVIAQIGSTLKDTKNLGYEQISGFEKEREDIASKVKNLEVSVNEIRKSGAILDKEISGDQREKKILQDQINKFTNMSAKTCVTCLQEVQEHHVATIIQTKQAEVAVLDKKITKLLTETALCERGKTLYNNQIVELNKRVEEINKQIQVVTTNLRAQGEKERQLAELVGQLDKQKLQGSFVTKRKEEILKETSPYMQLIKSTEIELADLEKIVNDKTLEITDLEAEVRYYNLLSKAFDKDGIPQIITEKAVVILNNLLKRYTQQLLGNEFTIAFDIVSRRNKNELGVIIDNKKGGPTYSRNSKGERKLIDLCQAFALSKFADMQNKCHFNFMWFDEVFAELDPNKCSAVLEVLKTDPSDSKLITTHKDMFKEEFLRRITVQKTGNTSVVDVNF